MGIPLELTRWAHRQRRVVEWGNVVMGYRGQEFRETFRTERQAKERERQAKAGEPIGEMRKPVALKRERLY